MPNFLRKTLAVPEPVRPSQHWQRFNRPHRVLPCTSSQGKQGTLEWNRFTAAGRGVKNLSPTNSAPCYPAPARAAKENPGVSMNPPGRRNGQPNAIQGDPKRGPGKRGGSLGSPVSGDPCISRPWAYNLGRRMTN
jgi:hypothetical protein